MGGASSKESKDEEQDEEFNQAYRSVEDVRIDGIIQKSLTIILGKDSSEESRLSAIEILGNVAYVSDVRGVIKVGELLPFFVELIRPERHPPPKLVIIILSAISKIGFEMPEVQECLFKIDAYPILVYHLSKSSYQSIRKWATYTTCCCLGDVYEPLEYLKMHLSNAVVKELAMFQWEAIWGQNWGLCLAKLLGKTRGFQADGDFDRDLLDEGDLKKFKPQPRGTIGLPLTAGQQPQNTTLLDPAQLAGHGGAASGAATGGGKGKGKANKSNSASSGATDRTLAEMNFEAPMVEPGSTEEIQASGEMSMTSHSNAKPILYEVKTPDGKLHNLKLVLEKKSASASDSASVGEIRIKK